MATITITIKGRIEEIPTLGQFTRDAYNRDILDFQGYKPAKYVAGFLTNFDLKATAVGNLINPIALLSELGIITLRIDTNMIALRPLMDKLEGYVRDAAGLTVQKKDFGMSQVRKAVNKGDQEALNSALALVLQNITANNAALTTAGMPASIPTDIAALKLSLFNDNASQNAKEGERALLVTDNMDKINDFCKILKDIWADGKSLYKTSNKTKLKDYTNAQLINRIRQEELKTMITGTVKGVNGFEKKAKVVAKPVTGGRTKTVYTNKDGVYELKGLKPVTHNITVTTVDGKQVIVQATAVTLTTVTVDPIDIP